MIKVFYLDDELDLLEIFSETFSSDSVIITTFADPESFIAECSIGNPDLLIIDYRLPGTRGDIVAQKIYTSIPKCLITGDIQVATAFPFHKILHKPFNFEEINSTLLEFSIKK
ncbi:MAG: response regulator [Bdellovibrionales bacterium]